MAGKDNNGRQLLGIALLLVVVVVWVLSSELSRYLFVDLDFKRPFFATYVKSCLFTVFLIRYALCGPQLTSTTEASKYDKLESVLSDDSYETESLTPAEFEAVPHMQSDVESDVSDIVTIERPSPQPSVAQLTLTATSNAQATSKPSRMRRKVRFSLFREVRQLPARIAHEAKLARLPYRRTPTIDCDVRMSPLFRYTFYLAPLWCLSSLTYQIALVYAAVSTTNLISASSSLFVLIIGALLSSHTSDRFTFAKFMLVIVNLSGVALISQVSASTAGVALSLASAIFYALYIVAFSVLTRQAGTVDMNLLFGVLGIFSFVVFSPLMVIIHETGLEPQLPLPDGREMALIVLNALVGSIFSDYLWLYATILTHPLYSSLSLTLTVPLSMLADAALRHRYPSAFELCAAVPILASFIGATFITNRATDETPAANGSSLKMLTPKRRPHEVAVASASAESASLMADDEPEI